MNATVRTALRVAGALLVLAGGLLHLRIWGSDYRDIPSDAGLPGLWVVKTGFPVNAALSVVLAIAVVAFARRPIVWLAAFGLELGSIVALVLSRESSIFGWSEPLWSSDAKTVLVVEILAAVALGVLLVADFARSASPSSTRHPQPA